MAGAGAGAERHDDDQPPGAGDAAGGGGGAAGDGALRRSRAEGGEGGEEGTGGLHGVSLFFLGGGWSFVFVWGGSGGLWVVSVSGRFSLAWFL